MSPTGRNALMLVRSAKICSSGFRLDTIMKTTGKRKKNASSVITTYSTQRRRAGPPEEAAGAGRAGSGAAAPAAGAWSMVAISVLPREPALDERDDEHEGEEDE